MAKSKLEKIANIEEQITQLENQRKQLIQKQKEEERKARTRRNCKRHGLLETMLPETANITDEQYQTFLEKAVANDFGRRMLANIISKSKVITTHQPELQQSIFTDYADENQGKGAGQVG
jgi:hypothetical protein